jgi:hypothetical protein
MSGACAATTTEPVGPTPFYVPSCEALWPGHSEDAVTKGFRGRAIGPR